ncbi:MAG: EamA family transporter, partial [Hyphomicrobiaceae bacterium]
ILLCLGLGVFQLGFGLTAYTMGARAVPAAELALLSMVEVILGVFWVWLFLGEAAGLYTMLGGAILLGAISGNALSGARRRPAPIGMR